MFRNNYDNDSVTFSPQGRIFQVEYAQEAVKQGSLAGTVMQYPEAMAYLAVEALIKKLDGESVPEKIDSPVKLITKDNLADAGWYFKDK